MEPTWKEMDRTLVNGDILRTKLPNGKYVYGVCSGDGFGCKPFLRGNAIHMRFDSYDLARTLTARDILHAGGKPQIGEDDEVETRWEKIWGIEYLVEETPPAAVVTPTPA